MASASVVLYKSKKLKNGEHPIMIRIIKDRQTKYLAVGHSCNQELWDMKKEMPKRKHPLFTELTLLIEAKKAEANKVLLNIENENISFSSQDVKTKLAKKINKLSVFEFLDQIIKELKAVGKIGNSRVYNDLRRVLKLYLGDRKLQFTDIKKSFLTKFEQHLKTEGLNPNTMSVYFRTLRATINKAIDQEILGKGENPFSDYSISHLKNETEKRAISKEDVRKIENIPTTANTKLSLAQDFFMFSYYSSGTNFQDVALMKWKNLKIVQEDIIMDYLRSKTGKKMTIKLPPKAVDIINKYKSLTYGPENYIFPFLDSQRHIKPMTIANRLKKTLREVNLNLKELCSFAGVDEKLTSYVARHTFATTLKKSFVSTAIISEMMGHKSEAITQIYLDSFDDSVKYDASLNL
ncbi:site-specific integrase [Lacihabitans sp. CCS-44]|uniref:site-specific integrase n=1 Tax=Lacihabitans sp. CCS-44 TaxID=2487331 RepID=UPI0020CE7ABE|nr:site-specific integrase [Lacihabitans sp. CCS-44]